MIDHQKSVINTLNEWKRQSEGSDQSLIERIVRFAAEVNRARFAASLAPVFAALMATAAGAQTCQQLQSEIASAKVVVQQSLAAEAKCSVQLRPVCEQRVKAEQEALTALQGEYLKQCSDGTPYDPPLKGTAKPTYYVLTLLYAPPGNGSQVTYGSGSTTGTRTETTFEHQTNVVLEVETSFLRTDFEIGGGTTAGSSFEVQKSKEGILQSTSQQDALDHNEDTFYIWTNPQITITLATSAQGSINVGPILGSGASIVRLTARELKNPSLITDTTTLAALKGFGPSDYQAILNMDPFFFYPDPVKSSGRLILTDRGVQILGPDQTGGQIPGQGDKFSNETTNGVISGSKQDREITVLGGYEWDTGAKLAVFGGIHFTAETEDTKEKTTGTIQEAQYVLQSSTAGINAAYDVYYDTLFKTFAFVPVPNYSTIAISGVISQNRVKGQLVNVTFKNGTTRKIPVDPTTGEFRILGDPNSVLRISYGAKQISVTPDLINRRRVVF